MCLELDSIANCRSVLHGCNDICVRQKTSAMSYSPETMRSTIKYKKTLFTTRYMTRNMKRIHTSQIGQEQATGAVLTVLFNPRLTLLLRKC